MQFNMLDAKSQLSRLVKAALAGHEVVIASNGAPLVRLVPVASRPMASTLGTVKMKDADIDTGFSAETDAEVARLFGTSR